MAKKYLSLDEASAQLGISADQLKQLREDGAIRGFADRGSWKFREQDVEEYQRAQETDSAPEIPLFDAESALDDADADFDPSASDSDVRLMFDDDILSVDAAEESDVQLEGDSGPSLQAAASSTGGDSDSDVNLIPDGTDADIDLASLGAGNEDLTGTSVMSDSDSDVRISDSDSDVRLSDSEEDDSGIALIPEADSDSDVQLVDKGLGTDEPDSDSDVALGSGLDRTDSDIRLMGAEEEPPLAAEPEDSDLKLLSPDSAAGGLALAADESGISLEVDSGISLDADDSGISLEAFDSGAALSDDDSGITLEADDSGISLTLDDDSGISLDPIDEADMSSTQPMSAIPGAANLLSDSSGETTQFEMPVADEGTDSEFELAGLGDDDDDVGSDTSVLMFEDEEDNTGAESATVMTDMSAAEFDMQDSAASEDVYEDEFDDDDYEDDDDLDDVFEAEDEFDDDDDDFDSGSSQVGGFSAPAAARGVARYEADWSPLWTSLVGVGAIGSLFCAVVGATLVRSMWLWHQPGEPDAGVLSLFSSLFGG